MRWAAFAFAIGVITLALPLPRDVVACLVWGIALLGGAGVVAVYRRTTTGWRTWLPLTPLVTGFLGVLYAGQHAQESLAGRLPWCADAGFRQLVLTISDKPAVVPGASGRRVVRFEAHIDAAANAADCPDLSGRNVRLTWYDAPILRSGQIWNVNAKIRPPWSYQNPGGFDYERWLFGQRLDGTGYVREGTLLEMPPEVLQSHEFADWLTERSRHAGIVAALGQGDASRVTPEQWQWFRASGTVHLLVVSGLHVGIVAGVVFFLGLIVARALPAALLCWGSRRLASVLAIVGTGLFVLSTGSGLPAIRAWMMSSTLLLALAAGRRCSWLLLYGLGLATVLAWDPLAVHQQGFWLSFAAVAVLLGYFVPSVESRGWLSQLLWTQLVLYIGLTPVLAVYQTDVPAAGVLANLYSVPVVSLLVMPLVLLVVALWQLVPEVCQALLGIVDVLLDSVLAVVQTAAGWPTFLSSGLTPARLVSALAAGYLLLTGHSWQWRVLALATWVGWLVGSNSGVPYGEVRATMLDVGQGSAILVDTTSHRLVFDGGPRFPGGFDLGAAVVAPSLAATGRARIDTLVLSHDDVDHTGGAFSLLRRFDPPAVFASFEFLPPENSRSRIQTCGSGVSWQWDGVAFDFLHPTPHSLGSDNSLSCVLRVTAARQRLLLAGDIGRRTEGRIAASSAPRGDLDVDLAAAPHHGSNGSSSPRWIDATSPSVVFISAPRRSRYGHPHPDVLARYRRSGADVFVTGESGALIWESWRPGTVVRIRAEKGAYWVNQPGPTPRARESAPDG
jgi:competence protein ComEC